MHRDDQIQLIRKLKKQARHGDGLSDFLNEIKELGKDASLTKFSGVLDQITGTIEKVADITTHYEQVNADLRKGFGLNIKQSVEFGSKLDTISKNLSINSTKLKNYSIALSEIITKNKEFYTSGNALSTSLLKQRESFNKLGITTESQNKFLKISATSTKDAALGMQNMAKSTAAFAQKIETLTDESGVYEDILEGIVAVGADVAATFQDIPGGLELAVYKAKKLGMTLNDVVSIGDKMLDVETATGAEIEYQIFSGRQLLDSKGKNFAEEMRMAAATQDTARQMELMNDLIMLEGDEIIKNKQARESLATLTGKSGAELIEMVQTQRANIAANEKLKGLTESQLADTKAMTDTEYDNYILKKSQLSTQEQIRDQATKEMTEKRILSTDKAGGAEKVGLAAAERTKKLVTATDTAGDIANTIATKYSTELNALIGLNVAITTLSDILTNFGTSMTGFTDSLERTNAAGTTGTVPVKDFFASAASGTTISGNFGSFLLDSRDDILAAPGIDEMVGGSRNTAQATSTSNADITKLASAVVSAIKSLSINVENKFDGEKIATYLEIREQSRLNRRG